MADEQRTYVVPLRREFRKAPIYKRTRKATRALRAFIAKHMKEENVKIGKHLNLKMWERGNKNPPHKIEVVAYRKEDKDKNPYVIVELPGVKPEEPKKEVKKKKGGKLMDRLKDKMEEKPEEKKEEQEKKEKQKQEQEALEKKSEKDAEKAKPVAEPKKDQPKKAEGHAKHQEVYSRDDKKPNAPKKEVKK